MSNRTAVSIAWNPDTETIAFKRGLLKDGLTALRNGQFDNLDWSDQLDTSDFVADLKWEVDGLFYSLFPKAPGADVYQQYLERRASVDSEPDPLPAP